MRFATPADLDSLVRLKDGVDEAAALLRREVRRPLPAERLPVLLAAQAAVGRLHRLRTALEV
eukprot:352864-Chlamydomonas_euryale.AAC.6